MRRMRRQAEKFGAEIIEKDFVKSDFHASPFSVKTDDKIYKGKAVIIATGADTKWLGVPGEKEKIGHGVSSCAPCDAMFFRNKDVIVAGGGDTAMGEAIELTKFARRVTLVHRRGRFRASHILQQNVRDNPKIFFLLNSQIIGVLGDQKVEKAKIRSKIKDSREAGQKLTETIKMKNGKVISENRDEIIWEMPIDGIFVAIGNVPNSKIFKNIEVDKKGYIKVYDHKKTNIDGVFTAGDVHDFVYSQAITAAGFGCAAAFEAEHWLESL